MQADERDGFLQTVAAVGERSAEPRVDQTGGSQHVGDGVVAWMVLLQAEPQLGQRVGLGEVAHSRRFRSGGAVRGVVGRLRCGFGVRFGRRLRGDELCEHVVLGKQPIEGVFGVGQIGVVHRAVRSVGLLALRGPHTRVVLGLAQRHDSRAVGHIEVGNRGQESGSAGVVAVNEQCGGVVKDDLDVAADRCRFVLRYAGVGQVGTVKVVGQQAL